MVMPEKGHVFWHIFSAYALYKWWILMRTRPDSQRAHPVHRDVFFFTVLLFVLLQLCAGAPHEQQGQGQGGPYHADTWRGRVVSGGGPATVLAGRH